MQQTILKSISTLLNEVKKIDNKISDRERILFLFLTEIASVISNIKLQKKLVRIVIRKIGKERMREIIRSLEISNKSFVPVLSIEQTIINIAKVLVVNSLIQNKLPSYFNN